MPTLVQEAPNYSEGIGARWHHFEAKQVKMHTCQVSGTFEELVGQILKRD